MTVLVFGRRAAIFRFRSEGDISGATGNVVRSDDGAVDEHPADRGPGRVRTDALGGHGGRRPQPSGAYEFRLPEPARARVTADAASAPTFTLLDHVFPNAASTTRASTRRATLRTAAAIGGKTCSAACGTPLVAAHTGRVVFADT